MTATLTTVASLAKEVYGPRLVDQLQNEVVGLRRIERTSDGVTTNVGGKYVTFPIRISRNQGIGYRNELEALPTPGQQGYAAPRIPLRYGYGGIKLSGQTIKLVNKDANAFASAMTEEMDGLKDDIVKDSNRIFYGDGLGTMATVTADAANTVTVDSVQYLEVGQMIDIVTPGGTAHASNRQITAINSTTKVITYDGADASGTTVATDIVIRTGNYNREPHGLRSLVTATGSLYSVDPATVPQWAAIVDGNAGTPRALSEGKMIELTDRVRRNGGRTTVIFTGLGVRRSYFNLLTQQRRYTDTKSFEGGFMGLAFNNGREIPVVDDVDAPDGQMFFLDESSLKVYQEGDWGWMDLDGSIWQRVIGYDAYEATLEKYWEIGLNKRNANAVLQDITEG